MPVTIRRATADDKERCLALLDALRNTTGSGTVPPDAGVAFDSLLSAERGHVLVADEDGTLLGMASSSFNVAMRYGVTFD